MKVSVVSVRGDRPGLFTIVGTTVILTVAGWAAAQEPGPPDESAVTSAAEKWYPDAPYVKLKDRYEQLIASKPTDTKTLNDEYEMAMYLCGEYFPGWTDAFGKMEKGKDQFEKALRLCEHIVKYYPKNEYVALVAKAQMAGLWMNLKRDAEGAVKFYTDIYCIPTSSIVDSICPIRNEPVHGGAKPGNDRTLGRVENLLSEKASGIAEQERANTEAQLDFERLVKQHLRGRVIEACKASDSGESILLLDEIETRCATTDPELCRMAAVAKADAVAGELLGSDENGIRYWTVGTHITGDIVSHDVAVCEEVALDSTVVHYNAYGIGKYPCPFSKATEPDMLVFNWTKVGLHSDQSGTWKSATNTKSATLQAPASPGIIEITLAVDDLPLPMTSHVGTPVGTRKDDPVIRRCQLHVILPAGCSEWTGAHSSACEVRVAGEPADYSERENKPVSWIECDPLVFVEVPLPKYKREGPQWVFEFQASANVHSELRSENFVNVDSAESNVITRDNFVNLANGFYEPARRVAGESYFTLGNTTYGNAGAIKIQADEHIATFKEYLAAELANVMARSEMSDMAVCCTCEAAKKAREAAITARVREAYATSWENMLAAGVLRSEAAVLPVAKELALAVLDRAKKKGWIAADELSAAGGKTNPDRDKGSDKKRAPESSGKLCLQGLDKAAILQAHGHSGGSSKDIVAAATDESFFVRRIALELLAERSGAEAIPTLQKALNDREIVVRWHAAHLLGTLGDKSGSARMQEDFRKLLSACDQLMGENNSSAGTRCDKERLREACNVATVTDALDVVFVLAELGDRQGFAFASRIALEGASSALRSRAVRALTEIAKTQKDILMKEGRDPERVLCAVAEAEKDTSVFTTLITSMKALDEATASRVLEIAKHSAHQPELLRRAAEISLQNVGMPESPVTEQPAQEGDRSQAGGNTTVDVLHDTAADSSKGATENATSK